MLLTGHLSLKRLPQGLPPLGDHGGRRRALCFDASEDDFKRDGILRPQ